MDSCGKVTTTLPRISFGIIVLNGEPFTQYCLRALYPFAHEIIVVEGGSRHAAAFCTDDGHSTDNTLQTLQQFKDNEDPEDKVTIITREGFWEEKDQQSQAYAQRATGDYLWQVDIDEFYLPEDMKRIIHMLRNDPEITAISFHSIFFWGTPDIRVDGVWLRAGGSIFHRLFKFGPGYRYKKHRPPTVLSPDGIDLRRIKWLSADDMAKQGICLYHYAQIFPQQVYRKSAYYESLSLGKRKDRQWAEACFAKLEHPYRVHNIHHHPSWLERFPGPHPPQILRMMQDVIDGKHHVDVRQMDDVKTLLGKRGYVAGRWLLKLISPFYGLFLRAWWRRPWWLSRGGWQRIKLKENL